MKLEEYQNALDELESKFGKDSSKTLLKIIDMANLHAIDKINQNFDQKFNDFRIEVNKSINDVKNDVHKSINDVHKSINLMVFKIVGLLAAIIALIKFLPEIIN